MALSAQAAIFSFGPQAGKGAVATDFYRHRALAVDLSVIDETREGQPEIGGLAVPTFPYKPGPVVGGGASLQPRMNNTIGWLLYAALGQHFVSPTGTVGVAVIASAQSITAPGAMTLAGDPATPSYLVFDAITITGSVTMTVVGTDANDVVISEVITISGVAPVRSKLIYKLVTTITITAAASAGTMNVGTYTATPYDHKFVIDPTDSTFIPWLSARKALPKSNGDTSSDLGEIYTDVKVTGLTFSMANDALLVMRADFLGCNFTYDHSPDVWTYANSFEDWKSVPVMCSVGGYIKIDGVELPVVAAQVSLQNVPLDIRQERVIGNPYLEDITILQRRLAYQLTVKWANPDLYAQVATGSTTGTAWTAKPTTAAFEVACVSSVDMPGTTDDPFALTIHADEAMLSHQGGIQLAGNGAVMLNFQGVALEQTEYCSFTLHNQVADYVWPT